MENNTYKKDIKVIKTKKPDKITKGLIAIGVFFFLIFIYCSCFATNINIGEILIWIIIILIIISPIVTLLRNSKAKSITSNIVETKFNVLDDFDFKLQYCGGFNDVSIRNTVRVFTIQEGILFRIVYTGQGTGEFRILKWEDIIGLSIKNKETITRQVKMGNLIFFGALAFGMDKKQKITNEEFIIITIGKKVNGKDITEYNIALKYDNQNETQEIFNTIKNYQREYGI